VVVETELPVVDGGGGGLAVRARRHYGGGGGFSYGCLSRARPAGAPPEGGPTHGRARTATAAATAGRDRSIRPPPYTRHIGDDDGKPAVVQINVCTCIC
jgi:hypothetical protein